MQTSQERLLRETIRHLILETRTGGSAFEKAVAKWVLNKIGVKKYYAIVAKSGTTQPDIEIYNKSGKKVAQFECKANPVNTAFPVEINTGQDIADACGYVSGGTNRIAPTHDDEQLSDADYAIVQQATKYASGKKPLKQKDFGPVTIMNERSYGVGVGDQSPLHPGVKGRAYYVRVKKDGSIRSVGAEKWDKKTKKMVVKNSPNERTAAWCFPTLPLGSTNMPVGGKKSIAMQGKTKGKTLQQVFAMGPDDYYAQGTVKNGVLTARISHCTSDKIKIGSNTGNFAFFKLGAGIGQQNVNSTRETLYFAINQGKGHKNTVSSVTPPSTIPVVVGIPSKPQAGTVYQRK